MPASREQFQSVGLQIVTPREYTAARTIFLKGIDSHIQQKTEEQIKDNIVARYPEWKFDKIIKLPAPTNIKITCSE